VNGRPILVRHGRGEWNAKNLDRGLTVAVVSHGSVL